MGVGGWKLLVNIFIVSWTELDWKEPGREGVRVGGMEGTKKVNWASKRADNVESLAEWLQGASGR